MELPRLMPFKTPIHCRDNSVMNVLVIILSVCLFVLIVRVAYWFAIQERKTAKSEPAEMDEQARQAQCEAAASITNLPMP
jgi:heme/copper-type cytochrome/quinol oxidase subunit 2